MGCVGERRGGSVVVGAWGGGGMGEGRGVGEGGGVGGCQRGW